MFQRAMLSDDDVDRLAEAAMDVLEHVGILCQSEELIRTLASWGAIVSPDSPMARFPKPLVLAFVEGLRRDGTGASNQAHEGIGAPPLATLEIQVAQFLRDDTTGERRPGSRDGFVTLIKLGEALHRDEGVGHSLLLTDVHPLLEPLEAAMLLAEYSSKPLPAFAWNVRQVDYLVEMGDILGISNWFSWGSSCFAHPLRFDSEVAERYVRSVRAGRESGLTGMQVSGFTTPVTAAGFIVVSAAEFVATWIAARAVNPQVALQGVVYGGSIDMRTGGVSYCSPDAMMRAFATSELLWRWCGIRVGVGGGEYCDARKPGLYTALEKAYKAMTIAAFTGYHPRIGQGLLESGRTISPVQLLLDRELGKAVWMLGQPVEVTPETIALETIFEVGIAFEKSYLHTDHTAQHFRDNAWLPDIIDRSGWNGAASDEALVAKALRRVQELIASYRKPDVDAEKLARMRQVVERARRELLP